VQGFMASSSINLGAGTLRVTGVAPVSLGSAVTANDVAASDATGAITLGLVGVGTVGTVVTGSGDDVITLSTAARTSGDYSISTGSGADSLTISFVEGFSWNGGLGYDTLKMNSTFDLTGQTVSLTSVDAISLDTENDGTESLTITAAQFNTNTTFTLLGGGSSADNLIIKGSDSADTINASAVSVEVGQAYLTLNGNSGADIITGSEFADRIDGGPGADVMSGGNLQDIYYFDSSDVVSGESIFEASTGTGDDTVSVVTSTDFSTMTAASFDEIEIITLAASQTATFTGAQLTGEAISLTAQSATTESILVNIGSGETFISGLTAGTNVNAIYYTGTSGDEVITGGALNETITGNSGNDVLTGGGGNDTFVFSTSSSNGIDSIYFGVVTGSTVDDILDFTANDAFLGTSTVSRGIFAETDVTDASTGIANDAANQNVLFLTGDYFADAATLAAATTVFAAVGAGKVLVVYAGTSSDHARIAVCTLDAAGDVTSATDVAILVGVTALEASTGLTSSNFILD
jgi:Ca2+-binding RTX toxin-like protein